MQLSAVNVLARVRSAWLLGCAISCSVLGLAPRAQADEPCPSATPWSHLSETAATFASPAPLTLTALAVVTPFGLAPTGVDQRLRVLAQRDLSGRPNLEPVSVATPYVLAGGLLVGYGVSAAFGACSAERAQAPVIQAMAITFATVAALKWGVGRRWPNGGTNPRAADRLDHPERAHDFEPFRNGFGAWPSGHTATMFAAAAAFRSANPGLGVFRFTGYPLAVGVAAGMWLGDHHWGSDIVSGALLGEAIGESAGGGAAVLGVPGALSVVPRAEGGIAVTWAGVW